MRPQTQHEGPIESSSVGSFGQKGGRKGSRVAEGPDEKAKMDEESIEDPRAAGMAMAIDRLELVRITDGGDVQAVDQTH
ncbi:hypothetical protein KM043_005722 [Ampulex compressa]|nr:hypothetical protein KM043_005722 [Ampulex compressa]